MTQFFQEFAFRNLFHAFLELKTFSLNMSTVCSAQKSLDRILADHEIGLAGLGANAEAGCLLRHDALDDVKILGRILIPMLKQFLEERDDLVNIVGDKPMGIRRHPPIVD